jgi:uncharacterized protein
LGASAQEPEIPKLTRWVTDLTNTLTASEVDRLDNTLRSFERATSTQILVLVVPTVGTADIEEVALRIAEANRIGKKGKDNGALLLVAKNDRLVRIEVGYGLEGVLPDALAGQIIRREIVPAFRDGDFYGGIKAGIEAIMMAARGEYGEEETDEEHSPKWIALLLVFFIFFFVFNIMRARHRLSPGGIRSLPGPFWGGFGGRIGGGWSGGGFRGGGGSFGGGGATGRW